LVIIDVVLPYAQEFEGYDDSAVDAQNADPDTL
jgi:hypothetical protein